MIQKPSIEDRLTVMKDLLNILEGPMKNISSLSWKPTDGFWTVVLRSVLVRQFEALQAIVDLVETKRAHLCVPLLRPAVEEHLWIKFLETLSSEDREEFLFAKSQVETFETLNAQWTDAGAEVMAQLGFPTEFLEAMRAANERGRKVLKEIATRLGWSLRNNSIPSTWFVANQTGNESLYSLIYHATSRTVHFTVAELLRRGWGNAERMTISSKPMDEYWAGFSLYWSFQMFVRTFLNLISELDRLKVVVDLDEETMTAVITKFTSIGSVPIITPEEMNLHLKES